MGLYIISQPWTHVAGFDELHLCILHAESYDPWCIDHIVSGRVRMTSHFAQCKLMFRQEVDNLAGNGFTNIVHCNRLPPPMVHPITEKYRGEPNIFNQGACP